MSAVTLRPTDLPRLRDSLVEFARSDLAAKLRELDAEENRTPPEPVAESMRLAADGLTEADLFYVGEDMSELVQTAAATLPEFALSPDDPPSRSGLAWFAAPIRDSFEEGTPVEAVAIGWHLHGNTVRVATFVERDELKLLPGRLAPVGFPPVFPIGSWDSPVSQAGEPEPVTPAMVPYGRTLLAAVKTMWLLMRQPLADVTVAEVDRAARRRAHRDGHEPAPVRVIALRRPAGHSGTGEGRDWHHRWIVRGHWRNARVGVGREQTRPVWIAPHIKGPEDAPLLGGEKVYAWTR